MDGASAGHDEANGPNGQGRAPRSDSGNFNGLLVYGRVTVASVEAVVVVLWRLDAHALVLGMSSRYAGEELVIYVVGEAVAERVLVRELLGDVAGIGPRGLGRISGASGAAVVMMAGAVAVTVTVAVAVVIVTVRTAGVRGRIWVQVLVLGRRVEQ